MQVLLLKIQDLLDIENISPDIDLKNFEEWDSLAMIALMSFIQKNYQADINLDILNECKNLQNIYEAIKKNSGGGGVSKFLSLLLSFCLLLHFSKKIHNLTPLFLFSLLYYYQKKQTI